MSAGCEEGDRLLSRLDVSHSLVWTGLEALPPDRAASTGRRRVFAAALLIGTSGITLSNGALAAPRRRGRRSRRAV